MPDFIDPSCASFVADCGNGPTIEQRQVIDAISTHLWGLRLTGSERIDAEMLSHRLTERGKRRFIQLAIIIQCCRHPADEAQAQRLDAFALALGVDGAPLEALRSWFANDVITASADYVRNFGRFVSDLSESKRYVSPDEQVLPEIAALFDLPVGTLGWAYLQFYERHGFALPSPTTPAPLYYVSHDMNHVRAGYEPDGPGEIALGAFKVAMHDSDANWMAFMTNLMIQESGLIKHGHRPEEQFIPFGAEVYVDGLGSGALHLPGASDLLAEAFVRGEMVTSDFSQIDHLAIAHRSVVELREAFNITPRRDGFDEVFAPKYR